MRLAVHVAREVLGRPAQLEQHLLDLPAFGGMDGDGVRVDPRTDQRGDPLGPEHLLEHRPVGARQDQAVRGVLAEGQPPVAVHGLGDVDEQRVRHRIPAVLHEGVDDLLGVVPGGPRVPQSERGHPVGVDVLGSTLQFGERSDGPTAVVGLLVIDFEKQGLVGLNDERTIHARHPFHVA
ncbi:hypothetical protein MBT84_23830 [Streptomyces sp. MBT84]|nr:hypothetical protein [Streptomyces sp. MBT84]